MINALHLAVWIYVQLFLGTVSVTDSAKVAFHSELSNFIDSLAVFHIHLILELNSAHMKCEMPILNKTIKFSPNEI